MRIFYAIFFEKKMLEALENNQEYIKNYGIKGRFVKKNKLHLTLKFLGEVEEEKLRQIKNIIKPVEVCSFKVNLGELGVFPPKGQPRVLWQGLEGETKEDTEEIFKLKELLESKLKELGFEREKRKFKPHITLARDPKNVTGKDLLEIPVKTKEVGSQVVSFSLMSSKLTKNGPIYDEICCYDLQ